MPMRAAFGVVSWRGNYVRVPAFNSFKLTVRLERADKVEKTQTCDLTSAMNRNQLVPNPRKGAIRCATAWLGNAPRYQWTSDAVAKIDIHGDGKGTYTWNLRGSPEIY